MDRHRIDADLGPAFLFDADPDLHPTFHFDADPDPILSFTHVGKSKIVF